MIDPDSVPSTIEAAANQLAASNSQSDGEHFGIGLSIRNQWSLWENNGPLKRDAAMNFGIAHADYISGLILAWAKAIKLGESFSPIEHCHRYHAHWERFGTDSLAAGGWHRNEPE